MGIKAIQELDFAFSVYMGNVDDTRGHIDTFKIITEITFTPLITILFLEFYI